MISNGFVLFLVGVFIFSLLLACLCNELCSNWKRRVILRRDAHIEKVRFALSEGETIVGVRQEQNTLCFIVANHKKDEKEYE